MNTRVIKSNLLEQLKNKKYRNLFIAGEIKRTIPYQLRALRAARQMSQAELAEAAETTQSVISRIENRGAANLSIQTLLKLAEAFDVGLVVRFESIDKILDWADSMVPQVLSPNSSEEIISELERKPEATKSFITGYKPALKCNTDSVKLLPSDKIFIVATGETLSVPFLESEKGTSEITSTSESKATSARIYQFRVKGQTEGTISQKAVA